ncbi:MAG TPA: PilZ domain-containing protein [Holophaga sp.]|nr:PilZ domain-containing protein [Holophaga sp.]
MATTIKKREEILEILGKACARKELLILATPFLRFESSFVALREDELHALATMSREDAVYGLRSSDLKLRFPYGLGFYEASVASLGLGLHEGRHTIRLSIPRALKENDQRTAYRVERVGRVPVTFSTAKASIQVAGLVDISTSGAQLHIQRDLPAGEALPGDRITLDIPLSGEISIHSSAVVRHQSGRRLGVQFTPELPTDIGMPLSRWVFLRREEERERLARQLEGGASPEPRTGSLVPEGGIALVSPDASLEAALQPLLGGIRPLVRLAPTVQDLREAMLGHPALVVFHLESAGLDQRRRMKMLAEIAQRKVPTLLLGTNLDGATLFELSSEWRMSSAIAWAPERAPFLQRLVQGILRRHAGGGDSPMAPMEGQP